MSPDFKEIWPIVKLAMVWFGLIAGGVVGLGCFFGLVSGVLQGAARPFGRGKADFWVTLAVGLVAAGIATWCGWRLFASSEAVKSEDASRPSVQQATPARPSPRP
jgi:hypothetical protein